MKSSVSDERLVLIASGIADRLAAGASGAPDLERDIASAITELLSLRSIPRGGVSITPAMKAKAAELLTRYGISSGAGDLGHDLLQQVLALSAIEQEQGQEYDPDAPADHSADNAADFIFKHLSKALGVDGKWFIADGSETWEGDVSGTLFAILIAAGIWDEYTGQRILSPSVCEGKVTEEMVEKAAKALYEDDDLWSASERPWPAQDADTYRRLAKSALTAALSQEGV